MPAFANKTTRGVEAGVQRGFVLEEELSTAVLVAEQLRELSAQTDYLSKPSDALELLARVRAIVQPTAVAPPRGAIIIAADLQIDLDRREVRRGHAPPFDLTAREFDLLARLASRPGTVFSRSQLLDQVWDRARDADEHTVSSHVHRLRSKLEPQPSAPRYVLTCWGVGYCFAQR